MKLTECLDVLVAAEQGRAALAPGRYALLMYGVEEMQQQDEDADEDDEADDEDDEEAEDESGLTQVGEADSFPAALDRLGQTLLGWMDRFTLDDYLPKEGESVRWFDEKLRDYVDLTAHFRALRTPARLAIFSYVAGSLSGPFYTVDAQRSIEDPYVGDALVRFPGARFVFGMGAAPPNQDQAWCIVEQQPIGTLSAADRALHAACATDDLSALHAALAAGAGVNSLDERGTSPLHVAVAHRQDAAVAALIAAGADVKLQSAFGNAPQFASFGADGQIFPLTQTVDDDADFSLLSRLVEAGAEVNARSTLGLTLVDLLLNGAAYPAARMAWLRERGGRSGRLRPELLRELLRLPPWGDLPALRILVNQVRYVLEDGADANQPPPNSFHDRPLQTLIGSTGYSEKEIPGDVLEELVALLLRHGAQDSAGASGKTARQHAESWVRHGFTHYEGVVRLLSST